MLGATGMARHAPFVDLLCRSVLKRENLCDVASTCNVGRPRAVASLAALFRGTPSRVAHRFPMRSLFIIIEHIFVARLTSLGAQVIGRIRRARRFGLAGR